MALDGERAVGLRPDWYYYFLHKNYSGAEMYWKWAGFKSGYRVRFKEEKSNVKRIMPVRVTAKRLQRQKLSKSGEKSVHTSNLSTRRNWHARLTGLSMSPIRSTRTSSAVCRTVSPTGFSTALTRARGR